MGNTSFSSGFNTGYGVVSDWKARKEAKAKIDKAAEEMKTNTAELAKRFDMRRKDGVITDDEYGMDLSWATLTGTEISGVMQDMYKNYKTWSKEELDGKLEELDAMYQLYVDSDNRNISEMKNMKFTKPKAKIQQNMYIRLLEEREPKQDPLKDPEYFTSLIELRKKYGKEAEGSFAQGKGWVYTGEKSETKQPKSSDYVNMIAVLKEVATTKTSESFQEFKSNMEKETGIDLGDIKRADLLDIDTDEIQKADFDTVFFGTRGIMNEYSESAQELDEEAKREILNKWKLRRPLMSAADQAKGDKYMASIGVDMNMPAVLDIDTGDDDKKDSWYSYKNITKWVESWSNTIPNLPETKGGLK